MKKRISVLLLTCLMLLVNVFTPLAAAMPVQAAEDLVLKLHYNRPDGAYDGWDVWLWEEGREGAGYAFAEENGEMVATKVLTPGTSSVGFIVRTQEWAKDIGEDQFIDIAEMVSGTVHIYVESGVKGYTKVYAEDAVMGIKLTQAGYNDETKEITVKMTGVVEGDLAAAFTVTGAEGTVTMESITAGKDNQYILKPAAALDLTKSYKISFDGNDYKIVMPNIYSTEGFEAEFTYTGNDLGATWTKDKTTFRVWAPTADSVKVNLYASGKASSADLIERIDMKKDVNGTWVAEKSGDLNGTYYTYLVAVAGEENEACDPYARTTGVNGKRAMVIDLDSTDPEGWANDVDPHAGNKITDAIIYELHVRDLSSDSSSGIKNVGKFLGLTETGTVNSAGISTGLDHIKDLGITHLHLLPSYDYGSVDEEKLGMAQFNWGYDPVNYNVPEGSYSTDPFHGEVRVKEMKEMVQTLHENGISVVMDVVYNHVQNAGEFCFNKIVPGYFSRIDANGVYSSGSGCGNDTASERAMVKKYIVDSVAYWADEYHIDGFRFDLVGLIDTETINAVIEEVHKTHPNVIFYGEGWTMNTTLTKEGYTMTTQLNSTQTPGFAFFSDTFRDALKGGVFDRETTGYVSGSLGLEKIIEKCFMGQSPTWCKTPSQSINYASCHDNLTLLDRLATSTPDVSRTDRIRMNNLAAAIYLTAEGVPFMQAGEEMLRTKVKEDGSFDENSYSSPDSVNSIKWDTLAEDEYKNVYNYYKGLIAFRKAHGALRLSTAEEVNANVVAADDLPENVTAFEIKGGVNGEISDGIFVIFNPNTTETTVSLPDGKWQVCVNAEKAGTEVLSTASGEVKVEPISAMVLVKGAVNANAEAAGDSSVMVFVVAAAVMVILGVAVAIVVGKKKKAVK